MNDHELIEHMRELLRREAVLDIEMINALQEIYARKLYLAHGSPSFHAFCTQVLGMSDDSAWRRMHAAKLANEFPRAKEMIKERTLSMTNAALLSKVATAANADRLFDEVANKSKREVEVIVRREDPKPDLKSGTRKLAEGTALKAGATPLSHERWGFKANMDAATRQVLRDVEDLATDSNPDAILRAALLALREQLRVQKRKTLKRSSTAPVRSRESAAPNDAVASTSCASTSCASTSRAGSSPGSAAMASGDDPAPQTSGPATLSAPSKAEPPPPHDPHSRYVPNWIQREVRERDGHRCTFVGPGGRCTATRDLQVHHIVAYAIGGLTVVDNLTLHCGAHNRHQAALDLGGAWANSWRQATEGGEGR